MGRARACGAGGNCLDDLLRMGEPPGDDRGCTAIAMDRLDRGMVRSARVDRGALPARHAQQPAGGEQVHRCRPFTGARILAAGKPFAGGEPRARPRPRFHRGAVSRSGNPGSSCRGAAFNQCRPAAGPDSRQHLADRQHRPCQRGGGGQHGFASRPIAGAHQCCA